MFLHFLKTSQDSHCRWVTGRERLSGFPCLFVCELSCDRLLVTRLGVFVSDYRDLLLVTMSAVGLPWVKLYVLLFADMFQVSLKKWSDLQGKSATCGRLNLLRTALDIASGGEQGTAGDPGLFWSAVVYPGLPWSTWSALPCSAQWRAVTFQE